MRTTAFPYTQIREIDYPMQTAAIIESFASNARHALGDGDGGEAAAIIVFANYFISVICKLNGRKVVS